MFHLQACFLVTPHDAETTHKKAYMFHLQACFVMITPPPHWCWTHLGYSLPVSWMKFWLLSCLNSIPSRNGFMTSNNSKYQLMTLPLESCHTSLPVPSVCYRKEERCGNPKEAGWPLWWESDCSCSCKPQHSCSCAYWNRKAGRYGSFYKSNPQMQVSIHRIMRTSLEYRGLKVSPEKRSSLARTWSWISWPESGTKKWCWGKWLCCKVTSYGRKDVTSSG